MTCVIYNKQRFWAIFFPDKLCDVTLQLKGRRMLWIFCEQDSLHLVMECVFEKTTKIGHLDGQLNSRRPSLDIPLAPYEDHRALYPKISANI